VIAVLAFSVSVMAFWLLICARVPRPYGVGTMAIAAILGLGIAGFFGEATIPRALTAGVALGYAAVCAVTDLLTGYVFDRVTIAGAIVLTAIAVLSGAADSALAGSLAAGLPLGALFVATRGRAIGLGDVKCAAVLGAAMGPQALVLVGLAFVLGALWAIPMLVSGRVHARESVAFAPFFAVAAGAIVVTRSVLHG
jgi:leader peptidase (prepilin peptidase)/N-methyltransferase